MVLGLRYGLMFPTAASNFFGSSVWNFPYFALLTSIPLRWLVPRYFLTFVSPWSYVETPPACPIATFRKFLRNSNFAQIGIMYARWDLRSSGTRCVTSQKSAILTYFAAEGCNHAEYACCALYRVSIKSFPDYKHLLQENYCTWNTNIFFFEM